MGEENQEKTKLDLLASKLEEEQIDVDVDTCLRFLRSRHHDENLAFQLIKENMKWREQMQIKELNISHVQDDYRALKIIFPGTVDKQGRPIVIFNSGRHDPTVNFMQVLKLAAYTCELCISHMGEGVEQVFIINNLKNATRDNFDNRMVKYMLEIFQNHYAGRIGEIAAVEAPWIFRVLFNVLKPLVRADIMAKIHLHSGTDDLTTYIDIDNLPECVGGTMKYDPEEFLQKQAEIENVDLKNPSEYEPAPEILAVYTDYAVPELIDHAIISGNIKKQGGYVRSYNKRFVILTKSILYYYKEKTSKKPEGVVILKGATLKKGTGNSFCLVTSIKKKCYFSTSEKNFDKWFQNLSRLVSEVSVE